MPIAAIVKMAMVCMIMAVIKERGLWAGPFSTYSDMEVALRQLDQKFSNPPGFEDAGCCNPGS
jgi:hypothetical protein